MKIKAAQWAAPGQIRLIETEKPVPGPGEVLVRVESVGVCGSDIHYFLHGRIGENRLKGPTILGHEYAGIVEAAGEGADPLLVGRRVAVEPGIPCGACEWCRSGRYNVCEGMVFPGGPGVDGALREYMVAPAGRCFPVPAGMTAAVAAMIEPAAVAVHTVELARLRPGDTVFVAGLGPIGLLTAQVARLCGAAAVYGADLYPERVAAARAHGVDEAFQAAPGGMAAGARATVDWLFSRTGGRGADVTFDCTNSSDGILVAMHCARPAGRAVLTGISGAEEDPVPVSVARRRGLGVQWCRRFLNNYPATLALAATGRLDVGSLVTHSFPLERTQEAFQLVADYADGVLKASVDF
ncbi:MAG TPA: alcohol dehydrogenase catalytic domain-containing protein [Candidatus Hydrogenedentes bacterium]|nr:alcohol dehydrogenase catalytic domain-containing protein [Candidatus Hydrogenedentota bacterium]HRZ81494.1 alcohol dehydrogenase catalytic domain-containing protein [Candidatus Hydrogenedentota bacterium]